jgi:hypothetical protein
MALVKEAIEGDAIFESVLRGMVDNKVVVGPVSMQHSTVFLGSETLMFWVVTMRDGGKGRGLSLNEMAGKTGRMTKQLRKTTLRELRKRKLIVADCRSEQEINAAVLELWPYVRKLSSTPTGAVQ